LSEVTPELDAAPAQRPDPGEQRWRAEHRALASWRAALFSSIAPGQRGRSGADAVRLAVAALASVVVVLAYRSDPSFERWWVRLAVPPPTGIAWLLTGCFLLGTFGAAVLLGLFALLVRRRDLSVDLGGGFAAGLAASYLVQFLLGVSAGRPADVVLHHVNVGFPVPVLTAVVAMVVTGRPYFARGVRRGVAGALTVAVLGAVATGRALPLALLGSLVIGWACASALRLALGRPRVGVSPDAVADALAPLGIKVASLAPWPARSGPAEHRIAEWGVERLSVTAADGSEHRLSVYGRDASDAEMLSSLWRFVSERESGVAPFLGRQQQAEHEALAIAAIQAICPGAAPGFEALAATAGTRDVLVVATVPVGETLRARRARGALDATELRAVAELVQRVHAARISLGSIDLDHLQLGADGRAMLDDTLHAELDATPNALYQDVASLLALLGLLSDPDAAVAAVTDVFGRDEVVAALAFLEKPALNAHLRREIRDDHDLLGQLRAAGARAAGVPEPKLAELRRVSPMTLVLGIGTVVGGWALLGVLLNVAGSLSTLRGANWGWVAAAFALAQAEFAALAVADLGSITGRLPLGRLSALEVSNTFSGLAIGAVAVMAARVRFFQREGYDSTVALSSSVLVSLVSWVVKFGLFALALPFAWGSIHLSTSPGSGGSRGHLVAVALVVVIALSTAIALAVAVPRWRTRVERRLAPKLAEIRHQLRGLAAQPRKLLQLVAGTLAAQLLVVLTLGAALHAFGAHLPVATLVVVLTVGSLLRGVSPAPGGIGVVEATLILGLTGAGVAQTVAVAAVFVQRLFTSYLPPIWGYLTLVWMRRREYL
jgi:uncharacterized protein (TIRG00374 family)